MAALMLIAFVAAIGLGLFLGLWRRTKKRLKECEADKHTIERTLRILEEERHVLELIAKGATLKQVLEALTQAIENVVPDVICSVLLVDSDRRCLLQGAAPHLPKSWWDMCNGVPILPDLGCCPAAASRNEPVISEDIATDRRWASVRDQVLAAGLRSCWSVPIREGKTGQVVGTFAMYHRYPTKPAAFHMRAVEAGAYLAGNTLDRLRAEQDLREYAGRFEMAEKAAAFGIWEWRPATQDFFLSEGAARISGLGRNPMVVTGDALYATIHPHDRESSRLKREQAMTAGSGYIHEFRRIFPDGAVRWYRIQARSEFQGSTPVKMVGAILDITQHKELMATLEHAKTEAEHAARAKSEFLANMSHEIRTPMNAVMGMTTLLMDLELSADARDYVETIRTSSHSLLGILNDILDLSKIESGRMELEHVPFELSDRLEDAAELLYPRAREKGLELAVNLDPQLAGRVYGDPTRLRQIVVNLISNAVKFTEAGRVVVNVSNQGNELQIAVDDTGIGISEENVARMFQPFQQLDSSTTRRFGGTGLGLSISRRLADLMGGRLTVASQLGQGSTFTLTLPYHRCASQPGISANWAGKRVLLGDANPLSRRVLERYLQGWGLKTATTEQASDLFALREAEHWDAVLLGPEFSEIQGAVITRPVRYNQLRAQMAELLDGISAPQPKPESPFDANFAQRHPLTILVADDNLINQKVAVRLLERFGYSPDTVQNGLQVLSAVLQRRYDLVLLDVQMPEMDGVEAARQICAMWEASDRPHLTALTAGAFKEDRERCLEAGMDSYLSKPIDVMQLRATLEICASSAGS